MARVCATVMQKTRVHSHQLHDKHTYWQQIRQIERQKISHSFYYYEIYATIKIFVSKQNQLIKGSKLFFTEIIKTSFSVEKFERPGRTHKLPNVLSKEEVSKIWQALPNQKHSTMLSLIYACGLRRSELINLNPTCKFTSKKSQHLKKWNYFIADYEADMILLKYSNFYIQLIIKHIKNWNSQGCPP